MGFIELETIFKALLIAEILKTSKAARARINGPVQSLIW